MFILGASYFIEHALVPGATKITWGFSAYYTAARLLILGADMSRLYDPAWFRVQLFSFGISGPKTSDIWLINPPTMAILFVPFAGFNPMTARFIWTGLSLILTMAALLLLIRKLKINSGSFTWLLPVSMALAFSPLHENFRWGQAYILLLNLHIIFFLAYLESREALAGISLAWILILKTYGAFLLLFLLFRRRWRILLFTLAITAIIIMLSLFLMGGQIWKNYLQSIIPSIGEYSQMGLAGYQTLSSILARLLNLTSSIDYGQSIRAHLLFYLLSFGLAGLFLIVTLQAFQPRKSINLASDSRFIAALVALSVPLAPMAEEYHYILLLLPLALLGTYWLDSMPDMPVAIIGLIGFGLLAAPIAYIDFDKARGLGMFLAYPKVYGALLIWSALLLYHHKTLMKSPSRISDEVGEV